jgi:predicted RNA-binding Zn-ribbon protein involved in translation (DUF1610 family)
MNIKIKDDYELIAKRCPDCESLIMAKLEKQCTGTTRYNGYSCSQCGWVSPAAK